MIYVYNLISNGRVKYVGLTKNTKSRKSAHKRSKPLHEFVIVESCNDATEASNIERKLIEQHNTYRDGWNKDPGGNYDTSSGFSRDGIGGRKKGSTPWNKGLTKEDPRVAANSKKAAATKKANGFYDDCSKYLPRLVGDANPMKDPERRKKMSELAKKRYRVYKDDGTWTWGYKD